ncbi:MAG: RHS repeat-associated core domain-containing protein [Pyrinomonadaceae bacterium]
MPKTGAIDDFFGIYPAYIGNRTSSHLSSTYIGRRVERNRGYGTERSKFTHDGEDVLTEDTNGTVLKYQNGPGIDNKLSVKQGTTTNYFLADHLGSTNALTDSTGAITASQSYDSFGNPMNSNFPTRYQFTGREYDQTTGLQFSRARMYDPKLGRFISEDPIGFEGGDVNLYGYLRNKPLSYRDPLGLFPSLGIWPFNVHQAIGSRALAGRATPYQIEVINRANERFDARTQDLAYAPQHAMRRQGQSVEDARAEANQFVRTKICEAREYAGRGLNTYAMQSLAEAIHTVQDAASPAHAGFQEAWPNDVLSIVLNSSHYLKEQFDPGASSVADENTRNIGDYFTGQREMPADYFSSGFDRQQEPTIYYGF